MQTFYTYSQYLAACTERTARSHRPPSGPYFRVCETCGKCCTHKDGMGLDCNSNSQHCYDCCHAKDVTMLKDRSKPFRAYLSCSGEFVTNWPGGKLGKVLHLTESKSGWHGSVIARFRVLDVHGQWWSGRGAGKGMFCTLRPMKGKP